MIFGSFSVNVTSTSGIALTMSSPFGPASILLAVTNGPSNGTYVMAITGYAGIFPNGWLFGVDMPLADLSAQLSAGFPFVGALGSCGEFALGPFGGLTFLSGITIYGVVLAGPPGSLSPTVHSPAVSHTIP
jgi:hypothetical protein